MQKSISLTPPSAPIKASITLPSSKSISNRLLIIKTMSGKDFPILNLSESRDTIILEQSLRLISAHKNSTESITIDIADAGTPMRFLTALLSITPGNWMLTGSLRMQQRPVGPLVEALCALGADITYVSQKGFVPLAIRGKFLEHAEVTIEAGISSQFISALMLIAPALPNGLTIDKKGNASSAPYISMTARLMQQAGIKVEEQGGSIRIGHQKYEPVPSAVEADWSAASFWYEIAAFDPSPEISLAGLQPSGLQGDEQAVEIFARLGVSTETTTQGTTLRKAELPPEKFFTYDFTSCPDLLIPVAVTCAGLQVEASLHGLKALRLKESDRLQAVYAELEALGYLTVIEGDETLRIFPSDAAKRRHHSHTVKTYDDHRMAMAFAPLSLLRPGICISNPDVVGKSYPFFWEDMQSTGFGISAAEDEK